MEALTEKARRGLADLFEKMANGDTVVLGEFGDAGTATDADEQADALRQLADELRR